jgi:uncharacterized protein DUF4255
VPPTIRVPLNTMLADLDETVRQLLKREMSRHGFDGVEFAFEAPSKDWSAQLSVPTVSLFLYDLRESKEHRPMDWEPRREGATVVEMRPPLRLDASYAVTAWTREVEDEHRILSQVLAVLYAYPELPEDVLAGTLAAQPTHRYPLYTRIAQPRSEGGPEFWTAVGGSYKASLDYCITVSCEPGAAVERGPEVRTQTVRVLDPAAGRGTLQETHRVGGVVLDGNGAPVRDAWVVQEDAGLWSVSDADGRVRFDRVREGEHTFLARTADGREGSATVDVPGERLEISVGGGAERAARAPARRKRSSPG